MEIFENIAEYYDELFPASDDLKTFYADEAKGFALPVKYLSIGCGVGTFEHFLAKGGADVTGLETISPLLESANRKRRTQLMALRFFQMSSVEMCRFLGKGFYNIIMIPNWRVIFTCDTTLMAKLFYDCKQLLANSGKLVLHLPNLEKFLATPSAKIPAKESMRAKLFSRITTDAKGKKYLCQELENGSGKIVTVTKDAEFFPLTKTKIEQYAKEVGFSKFSFYSDFSKREFTKDSDELIVVLS